MMRLDLNLIEIFCRVYEAGNISKAALTLRISQPTVSGHLKNLETYIGAKLFDRLPRRLAPTRAGQLLYRRGCSILKEKQAAMQDLERFLQRIEGVLQLSGSNIPGEYLLPPRIADFYAHFPAVRVELKVSDPKTVCNDVLSGEAELGFSCTKIATVGLEFRPFATGAIALVVPNNETWRRVRSISRARLAQEPFLARERGTGMRAMVEERIGHSLDDANVVGVFGSNSALKEALRAGMGVAIVSLFSVQHELARGELKTIAIEGLEMRAAAFFVVTNKSLTLSPIAETFLAAVLDNGRLARAALRASA